MKKPFKTIDLVFFNDEANGEWGLAHKETYNDSCSPFNAFWNAMGIFHDVFEHSHEFTHKYFRGEYAMNVGGEMAAMGAMWYYYSALGVRVRAGKGNYMGSESMINTTINEVYEAIVDGNTRYGSTLESNVPNQKPIDNYTLETAITDYWSRVQQMTIEADRPDEMATAKMYKKSVTKSKIANLHRYGYRMAKRMIPNNRENLITLIEFYEFWENFTKNNSAEELANYFRGIKFELFKDRKGNVTWKAVLTPIYYNDVSEVILTANSNPRTLSIEDYYLEGIEF